MAVVTLKTQPPLVTSSLRRPFPRLKATVTRDGKIVNMRSFGGYEYFEKYAMDIVETWYHPSAKIVRRGGEIEIRFFWILSQ
jgi:hypothetical protein